MRYQHPEEEIVGTSVQFQAAPTTLANSLCWRLTHGINYLIGGITFFVASVAYFPYFTRFIDSNTFAGWLYTVGSFCFLVADLLEWNHYRPTCCVAAARSEPFKIGLNFFCSAIGSLFYLIGSIFFIPATNALVKGQILFVVGSAIIVLSQAWKCYRTCVTPPTHSACDNIKEDMAGFLVDLFAGLGAFFYLIGTIVFSKADDITDPAYVPAVILFTIGGFFFLASGIAMQKRYFCGSAHNYDNVG